MGRKRKSVTVPPPDITWMGKNSSGTQYTLDNTPAYLAQMVIFKMGRKLWRI